MLKEKFMLTAYNELIQYYKVVNVGKTFSSLLNAPIVKSTMCVCVCVCVHMILMYDGSQSHLLLPTAGVGFFSIS